MPRHEFFTVDDGSRKLCRHVVPRSGVGYVHRVSFADVEAIAAAIERVADDEGRFTIEALAREAFDSEREGDGFPVYGVSKTAAVVAFARSETSLIEKSGRFQVVSEDFDALDLVVDVVGFNAREIANAARG